MDYVFTTPELDTKILLKNEISGINQFLLENNTKQIDVIFNFLKNNNSLLLVNGFLGTGKESIIRHCLDTALNDKTIVLEYNCFETTILDDILLSFFEDFKKLSALEKINVPKIKTENFTQKINAYFQTINNPAVVIINSFDAILKSNKAEILGFINHLCNLKNIKVVLISRVFDITDFEGKLKYDKVTILALQKSIFEKYLRSEDLKQIGPLTDELYKQTRGYFFYTTLTIKIMKLRNLNLVDFLDGYSKSFLSFSDFILREALALIDPVSGHLFRFLTVMRHPISVKLLKTLNLWNEDKMLFFINNLVLSKYGEYVYLQDYYKNIAENSIPPNVAIKLHQGCIDLYNTQLPLKPLERDIVVSRQTMRNEIEYHSMFIPKKYQFKGKDLRDINKTNIENTNKTNEKEFNEKEVNDKDQIKHMSFIFDDDEYGVLDKIADSIKNFLSYSDEKAKQEKEENKLSLTELMNLAKKEETSFNYKHAISLYLKALALDNDEDYYTYLPTIYTKLAFAYQNISDWYDAQKYFEMAGDFYSSTGDTEKINEAKFNIANIFYMTFKKDKAKVILCEIEKNNISDELRIKVLNALANLSNDSNIIYNYYKKALEINPINIDKSVLSELYFKFALVNEDRGDDKTALEYYKKCINLDSNPKNNPNLSSAISNIALLYNDIGKSEIAIKYYLESMKLDEQTKNLNGIYSSSMKLAEIYSSKDPLKAIEYYENALRYAKTLNEPFYIISTSTALGDFYFNRKENEHALKNYKHAYNYAKNGIYKENVTKILQRIEDIKMRVGEERFKELEK